MGMDAERDGGKLRTVNDRLREVIAELKNNRERLGSRAERVEPLPSPPAAGESPGDALRRVERELVAAQEELQASRTAEGQLRTKLAALQDEHRRTADEYVAAQEQGCRLASLFVALSRLHASLERREVLTAIQEVVVNVLGSEQLAVFELGPDGRFHPVHSMGVDASRLVAVERGEGPLGRSALGRSFVADREDRSEDPELSASIPLFAGDHVTAVLAVWQLLGHKPFLGEADLELMVLLSAHAGVALHAAALHELHGHGRT
jgi:hypothetical protein